jgi:hypothetical protein
MIKPTARLTGFESSSNVIDAINVTQNLHQTKINGQPYFFNTENLNILNAYKGQLSSTNLDILADKLAYKSTLTDKLAQKYMNIATDKINAQQLVMNKKFPIINNEVATDYINFSPTTEKPLDINEAINLAETLKSTEITNDPVVETVTQVTLFGKLFFTALIFITLIFGYKYLNTNHH